MQPLFKLVLDLIKLPVVNGRLCRQLINVNKDEARLLIWQA